MAYFKIQHTKTGLFSKGGSSPDWSKTGKVWTSVGALKSHLTYVVTAWYGDKKAYDDAVLLTFELLEITPPAPLKAFLAEKLHEKLKKDSAREVIDRQRELQRLHDKSNQLYSAVVQTVDLASMTGTFSYIGEDESHTFSLGSFVPTESRRWRQPKVDESVNVLVSPTGDVLAVMSE